MLNQKIQSVKFEDYLSDGSVGVVTSLYMEGVSITVASFHDGVGPINSSVRFSTQDLSLDDLRLLWLRELQLSRTNGNPQAEMVFGISSTIRGVEDLAEAHINSLDSIRGAVDKMPMQSFTLSAFNICKMVGVKTPVQFLSKISGASVTTLNRRLANARQASTRNSRGR